MDTVTDMNSTQQVLVKAAPAKSVDVPTKSAAAPVKTAAMPEAKSIENAGHTELPELKVAADVAKAVGMTKEYFEPKTEKEKEKLKDAITIANNSLKQQRTQFQFAYHEKINRVSITIVDSETKEVIKEIPPEKTLKALEKLWEISGILLDEKA